MLLKISLVADLRLRVMVMVRVRVRVRVWVWDRVRVRVRIGFRGHLGVEHLMGSLGVVVGETEPVVELATVVEDIG